MWGGGGIGIKFIETLDGIFNTLSMLAEVSPLFTMTIESSFILLKLNRECDKREIKSRIDSQAELEMHIVGSN